MVNPCYGGKFTITISTFQHWTNFFRWQTIFSFVYMFIEFVIIFTLLHLNVSFRRLSFFIWSKYVIVCEQLRKTFHLVETKGWDIARLYWVSIHSTHPDQNNITQHHDLYTAADNNVSQYYKQLQKHVIKSTCRSTDRPKSV